ncbi:MAG: hypothetical protein WC382_08420 [Methanoregulaceae archaeon]|jgi:hypothetical protein
MGGCSSASKGSHRQCRHPEKPGRIIQAVPTAGLLLPLVRAAGSTMPGADCGAGGQRMIPEQIHVIPDGVLPWIAPAGIALSVNLFPDHTQADS